MLKAYKKTESLILTIIMLIAVLAGGFSPAGISSVGAEDTKASYSVSSSQNASVFSVYVSFSNFDRVTSFSGTFSYNKDELSFKNCVFPSVLSNTMNSVNDDKNGNVNVAFVSSSGVSFGGDTIRFDFDVIKSGVFDTAFDIEINECLDAMFEDAMYNGYYNKNTYYFNISNTETDKLRFVFTDNYNANVFKPAKTYFNIDINEAGIYSGSMDLFYDPEELEITDVTDYNTSSLTVTFNKQLKDNMEYVHIAFISSRPVNKTGGLLEFTIVPKKVGDSFWLNANNIKLTTEMLDELEYESTYGFALYYTQDNSSEGRCYFKVNAPEKVSAGQEFTALVDLEENTGFGALTAELSYDSDLLEVVSAKAGSELFGTAMTSVSTSAGKVKIAAASTSLISGSGTVAEVKFKAKKTGSDQNCDLNLSVSELVDNAYESIEYTISGASVSISARIPGDVNDDGKVNMSDLTRLQQYLAEWGVTINASNANVNGDEKVNMQDLTRIQQKLAMWDVELV